MKRKLFLFDSRKYTHSNTLVVHVYETNAKPSGQISAT